MNQIVAKANMKAGVVSRSFRHLDKKSFMTLYKSLIRPQLEYCNTVWSPWLKKDAVAIEKVQRRITKCVPELKDLSYEDRLKALQLPTLAFRRLRADMIQVYRILTGIDNIKQEHFFTMSSNQTRGNDKKIAKYCVRTELRKNSFSVRVVNAWNKLPNNVINSKTLNAFKSSLKKHWSTHPDLFHFEF